MDRLLSKARGKALARRSYVSIMFFPNSIDKALNILSEKRFFLLTSTGRTGTKLFANMLNSLEGYCVAHEPVPREQFYHKLAMENPDFSFKYIKRFRLKEMFLRLKQYENMQRYGEVNSALRRNIKEIKSLLPDCKIAHIVRDGRDVVSSILNRKTFTDKDPIYRHMKPDNAIINTDRWNSMDRFQKICAIWNVENRYMREHCDITVKFENLIGDYSYAKTQFFDPFDIPVDYATWERYIKHKMNAREENKDIFVYSNWSDNEKQFFWNECGEEMKIYGY